MKKEEKEVTIKKEVPVKKENFSVGKFYPYSGPNFYLSGPAMVFNIYIDPSSPDANFFKEKIVEKFPIINEDYPTEVVQLYGKVLQQVFKMNLNLFVDKYSIKQDGEEWTIAVESLDDYLSEDSILFVSDWFNAIIKQDNAFEFDKKFEQLQKDFDRTLYGGPTIYSLIEAGIKRGVPVHYLYEENSFQWGHGKKQQRGRSSIFHSDFMLET